MEMEYIPIVTSILTIIGSAFISYSVAKLQMKSEIERIKLQYEFEQKKDNKNFLNKLLLENSFELKNEIASYCRSELQLANLICSIIDRDKGTNEEIVNEIIYESFKHGVEYPFGGAEVNSLMVFIPELEDKWRKVSLLGTKLTLTIPNDICNELKEGSADHLINIYKNEIKKFENISIDLIEEVREYTRKTIMSLQ